MKGEKRVPLSVWRLVQFSAVINVLEPVFEELCSLLLHPRCFGLGSVVVSLGRF